MIEDQPSWRPRLRSRIRLAATPKRHLADPSLAVAALGATPQRLVGPEIELAGFLFESQAIHDLRVYAQPHRGEVRFYRDNKGLEIDAIVEAPDGRWLAAEIELGHHRVDEAARHLLALKEKLSPAVNAACEDLRRLLQELRARPELSDLDDEQSMALAVRETRAMRRERAARRGSRAAG